MRKIVGCTLFLIVFLTVLFVYYSYILADSITSVFVGQPAIRLDR